MVDHAILDQLSKAEVRIEQLKERGLTARDSKLCAQVRWVTPFQGDTLHQFRHYMHQPSCLASLDLRLGQTSMVPLLEDTTLHFGPDPSVQLRWSYGRNVPFQEPAVDGRRLRIGAVVEAGKTVHATLSFRAPDDVSSVLAVERGVPNEVRQAIARLCHPETAEANQTLSGPHSGRSRRTWTPLFVAFCKYTVGEYGDATLGSGGSADVYAGSPLPEEMWHQIFAFAAVQDLHGLLRLRLVCKDAQAAAARGYAWITHNSGACATGIRVSKPGTGERHRMQSGMDKDAVLRFHDESGNGHRVRLQTVMFQPRRISLTDYHMRFETLYSNKAGGAIYQPVVFFLKGGNDQGSPHSLCPMCVLDGILVVPAREHAQLLLK